MSDTTVATLLIEGRWVAAPSSFDVVDPASLEVIGQASDATAEHARAALDAASAAFRGWAGTDPETRGTYLRAGANAIRARRDDLARLLSKENGKPLAEAAGELAGAARMLDWAAEEGRRADGRVTPANAAGPGLVLRSPVGPVLAITPWNFPASMLIRKVGLALAAGCTVVAKPAEQTPLIATALLGILQETGLPAGVLGSLTTSRPAELVDALLTDRRLRKVSFTGSTEVGLGLLRRTGSVLRRTSLEMGGHSPAIVLEDADLEAAASGVVTAKFFNAGQSCTAVNRLYVHEGIREDLLALIEKKTSALRLGRGDAEGVAVGPLIDEAGIAKVERQVADAVEQGARVLVGGNRWEPGDPALRGHFFQPTVLVDVTPGMLIAHEETFGPALAVSTFTDDEEVVELANATEYGLAAYVFGSDLRRIWRLLDRLDFGVFGVNDPAPVRPELPFGGQKNSGQEREGGSEGIDAYTETKAVALRF
ncbi:NAD-dependent succinate-semialdehyde dehydrogenase [Amycolatopsis sp. CA-230715]|uniref:NAD-dependent succinate-semialdehyde dehydrogenase n=1 Tax=Amycolatopsis sp. CA-230715 TaxID=2745196 RepID=UPI001C00C5F7|nr:NAD-dependent succinate-semialdehyde dehydrogenase [Amycolatopsis sp. CA-230715]QWF86025.1 Succinate-semialdehyde dehydrogenase [NADP(+)] GabD [Amycolatopsis sp. CA-230715]